MKKKVKAVRGAGQGAQSARYLEALRRALEKRRLSLEVRELRAQLAQLADRLRVAMQRQLNQQRQQQQHLGERLAALNPDAVLKRGYAMVENRKGQPVRSPAQLKQGERITLHLAEGHTQAEVCHPDGGQGSFGF